MRTQMRYKETRDKSSPEAADLEMILRPHWVADLWEKVDGVLTLLPEDKRKDIKRTKAARNKFAGWRTACLAMANGIINYAEERTETAVGINPDEERDSFNAWIHSTLADQLVAATDALNKTVPGGSNWEWMRYLVPAPTPEMLKAVSEDTLKYLEEKRMVPWTEVAGFTSGDDPGT